MLGKPTMPKIDYDTLEMVKCRYLPSLAAYTNGITNNYAKGAVGDKARLTQFGVNPVVLEPGAGTSMLHWHFNQDEFVNVVEGTVTLVDDQGEHQLKPKFLWVMGESLFYGRFFIAFLAIFSPSVMKAYFHLSVCFLLSIHHTKWCARQSGVLFHAMPRLVNPIKSINIDFFNGIINVVP